MKKVILIFSCVLMLFSCKKEEELTKIQGDFIFLDDAAVIKGEDFIYGVHVDEKTKELAKMVEPVKREKFDMIPVEVEGILKDNPNPEGWEQILEIKEIVNVSEKRKASKIKMN